jgi:hypothetical protein
LCVAFLIVPKKALAATLLVFSLSDS